MRINCPHCGERALQEFLYHGDAVPIRPRDGGVQATEAWSDYVYLRDNAEGEHRELWYHAAGCHAWLVVRRNLNSHEISEVMPARDVALERVS